MKKFPAVLIVLVVVAALLAGCNLPSLQKNAAATETAAALTVEGALTSAAPAATATFTAAPFPTLPPATATVRSATSAPAVTATSNCDAAGFDSATIDVTYPDNTLVDAGAAFTKTWRLKNIGTCSWTTSYALVFKSGDAMGGPAVQALTGTVDPGQTVDVAVNLTAPAGTGTYRGDWSLRNSAGAIFFSFWVQIKVGSGGAFTVTSVTFTFSTANYSGGYTDCPTVTSHITTNGAGDVQYHTTRSDSSSGSVATLHFASAGTQDVVDYLLLPTAAGSASRWLGMYIDSPNHQDFGHKEFTATCSAP